MSEVEAPEAGEVPDLVAVEPGSRIALALERLALAVHLVQKSREDARASGLSEEEGRRIGRRTRHARKEIRHLAAAIERAGIEQNGGQA